MIKIFFKYLAVVLIFVILISSCSNSAPSNEKPKQNYLEQTNVDYKGKRYNFFFNGVEGYEVLVPQNWLHKNNKNTALTIYTKKNNDTDFVESLDIISHQAAFIQNNSGGIKTNNADFNNFYASHLNDLTENSNLNIVAEGKELINKNVSRWVLLKTSNQGEKLHLLKYFVEGKKGIYILTGTCKETDYTVYGPQFYDIISSFKLL